MNLADRISAVAIEEFPESHRYDAPAKLNGKRHQAFPPPLPEADEPPPSKLATLEPVPMSKLVRRNDKLEWLTQMLFVRNSLTLLSAFWKVGKTTFVSHLIRALATGQPIAGLNCLLSRVLIVTEEGSDLWCDRRDALGLNDRISIIENPFFATPTHGEWKELVRRLGELTERDGYDMVIIDTLPSIWPVTNENDPSEVKEAVLPLRTLTEKAAVLLVAHLKKGESIDGNGTRGSGALMAAVDTIIEFKRSDPQDIECPRRVLTTLGRSMPPAKLTIELDTFANEFRAVETVDAQSNARDERQRLRKDRQAQQDRDDENACLEAIRSLVKAGEQASCRKIRIAAGLSQARCEAALYRLQREDLIRKRTLPPKKGQFGEVDIYVIAATDSQRD